MVTTEEYEGNKKDKSYMKQEDMYFVQLRMSMKMQFEQEAKRGRKL